jgi:hypothetical protein
LFCFFIPHWISFVCWAVRARATANVCILPMRSIEYYEIVTLHPSQVKAPKWKPAAGSPHTLHSWFICWEEKKRINNSTINLLWLCARARTFKWLFSLRNCVKRFLFYYLKKRKERRGTFSLWKGEDDDEAKKEWMYIYIYGTRTLHTRA